MPCNFAGDGGSNYGITGAERGAIMEDVKKCCEGTMSDRESADKWQHSRIFEPIKLA